MLQVFSRCFASGGNMDILGGAVVSTVRLLGVVSGGFEIKRPYS